MALAHRLGSGMEGHGPVVAEAQLHDLVEDAAGHLQEAGEADTAQPSGPLGSRAPLREPRPVGQGEGLVHDRLELAAVVDGSVRGRIGHRAGRDEVAPAQLHPVDPGGGGRLIDEPLDQVEGLRPPGAAIGPERRRVGEGQRDVDGDRGDAVDARQAVLGVVGPEHRRERGDVRADADARVDPQGQEAAGRVEGQQPLEQAVAAVGVGQEALHAGGAPLDRPAHPARREEQRRVLRVGLDLHPEAAPHVGGDHAELRRRDLEHAFRQEPPHHRDALGGGGEGVALGGLVPLADGGAGLERRGRDPRVVQAHPRDVRGSPDGRVHRGGVPVGPVEGHVARRVGPDRLGAVVERALHVRRRGQGVEIEDHRRGRIGGLGGRLGERDGHRLADVAHAVHRERGNGRGGQGLAAAAGEGGGGRDRAQPGRDEIAPGEDREHAGQGDGAARVHPADDAVGPRRAGERGVDLAGPIHVVGEAAAAGEERPVLAAPPADQIPEKPRAPVGAEAQRGLRSGQVRPVNSGTTSRCGPAGAGGPATRACLGRRCGAGWPPRWRSPCP